MKIKNFGLITLLGISILTLGGCNKTETPIENSDKNTEIANPASVYCEENGGTLILEEGVGICIFPDGSYCEERSFFNGECHPGDIIYNTISGDEISEPTIAASKLYSDEDFTIAKDAIMNVINNEWEVKVEGVELAYAGDDVATSNLEYCQSLNPEITECAVFTSNFHIPEQDVEMAGAFEPNTDINGWSWILGKNTAGEREVLTNGFG